VATAVWFVLLVVWLLSRRTIRESFGGVIRAALARKLVALYMVVLLYNTIVIVILRWVGVWDVALLKDTVIWFAFAGLALAFRSGAAGQGKGWLRGVLKDSVKVFIVVEFLANTYTLALAWEMVLVPLLVLLAATGAVAEADPKYTQVGRVTSMLLAVIGLTVICFAVSKAISDFGSLWSLHSLKRLFLPPVLSVLSIPMIYVAALYITYDQLFARLKAGLEVGGDVYRYANRRIRALCRMNLRKTRWLLQERGRDLMLIRSRQDVDAMAEEPPWQLD